MQSVTAAVWQLDAVLVPTILRPPPPPPAPKLISALASGTSNFSSALRAAPQVFSTISATSFRGTVLVPTDQVRGGLLDCGAAAAGLRLGADGCLWEAMHVLLTQSG